MMFVDVVESMLLLQARAGEKAAVQRMEAFFARGIEQAVKPYRGRVVECRGDGLLLRFMRTRDAVSCARALHRLATEDTAAHPHEHPLQLRAGMDRGLVYKYGEALRGMVVSLASRIEDCAQPGETANVW